MANTVQFGRRVLNIIPDGSADFNIQTCQSNRLPLNTVVGTFTVGETVTQAVSGATGIVGAWDSRNRVLTLNQATGTFDTTNVVTGGTSTAHGIPSEVSYAFPNGLRLSAVDFKPSQATDTLVIRENSATGTFIYARRDATGGGIHKTTGGRSLRVKPYIKASEQVWGTPANVIISLEYD